MNPQPPEYIGNLFAFLFICVAVFYFIKGMLSGNTINYDHFVIGYLDDEDNKSNTTYVINNTTNNKTFKQTKNTPSVDQGVRVSHRPMSQKQLVESNTLIQDCIEALCALGMKKTEAKKRALSIFNSSCPPVSVEEFLLLALKK
jgi:hypothetical protein